MRENIKATGARNHRREFGYRDCSQQGIDSAKYPNANEECRGRKLSGDVTGSAQDAHPDRAADGYRETEADAQNTEEGSVPG